MKHISKKSLRTFSWAAAFALFFSFQLNAQTCNLAIPGFTATNPTCYNSCDASITVNHTGGTAPYSYIWSNGATTKTITGLCKGTYTVTVTDAAGCTKVKSKAVTKSRVSVVTTYSNVSCYGACDGSITVNGQGGVAPYTYLWSNGSTTNTISGICANVYYTITVTDNNGCTFVCRKKVTQPSQLNLTTYNGTASCVCDGQVSASASGGTAPYGYSWSTGATTASISGLCAGTYTVTATDAHGCTKVKTATVAGTPNTVQVSCSLVSDESAPGAADGELTANASGGVGTLDYLWSNGQTTQNATGLTGGTYTVTVTDDNGCSASSSCSVNTNQPSECDGDFTTYTQGGWGNNGAPGQYMAANFENCFGSITIGDACGYTITLTTVQAVQDFLPQGTTPAALTQNYTDPGAGNITVLAGQLLSVAFALGFDDCDGDFSGSDSDLGDQIYTNSNSPFYGWSIQAIFEEGSRILSGCSSSYTPSEINDALTDVNENYDEGADNGLFTCPDDFNAPARLASAKTNRVQVSPNPFNDQLTITLNTDEELNISISDMTGRIYRSYTNVSKSLLVDGSWNDGIYLINIESADGYREVLKVVRTH